MTEVASPGLGKAEDLFRDLVWENLVQAELAALFAYAPYLAVWPVQQVIRGVADILQARLYKALRLFVDVSTIRIVNEVARREFDRSAVVLRVLERDHGLESPEYRKAKENAKDALAGFVRFRGA